jgi:hypothetical protein
MQFVQSKSPHKQTLITGVCLKVSSVEEAPLNHAPSSHSSLKLVLSIRKKTHFAISIMDKKSIVGLRPVTLDLPIPAQGRDDITEKRLLVRGAFPG